jgi:hypothetical protein
MFKKLMMWHVGDKMQAMMTKFKNWCGMPNVMGAIDDIHIAITKAFDVFAKNYYYHKIEGYSIVAQAMVDNQMFFTNVYVGLLGSVNENQFLRKSWLYRHTL